MSKSKKVVRRPITELVKVRCPNCREYHYDRKAAFVCVGHVQGNRWCSIELKAAMKEYYYVVSV